MKPAINGEAPQNVSILLLTEQGCPVWGPLILKQMAMFPASPEASGMTAALAMGESCCRAF